MAKKSVKTPLVLKTWDEVDNALRDLGEVTRTLSDLENEQTRKITETQEQYKNVAALIFERKTRLEADIEAFVKENRAQMDGKSRKLTFGTVCFRAFPSLSVPKGATQRVIDACKALGLTDCINSKETLLKDVLKRKGEDILKQLGVSIKAPEKFHIDILEQTLVDADNA